MGGEEETIQPLTSNSILNRVNNPKSLRMPRITHRKEVALKTQSQFNH